MDYFTLGDSVLEHGLSGGDNAGLVVVFTSGRCASMICASSQAQDLLAMIVEKRDVHGPVTLKVSEGAESGPVYHFFIRGSDVSHALVEPIPSDATLSPDDLIPSGFHDGSNTMQAPAGDGKSSGGAR